jgi:hypothetical protein
VLGKGGVTMVATAAPMCRDPLAPEKDLDRLRRPPNYQAARPDLRQTAMRRAEAKNRPGIAPILPSAEKILAALLRSFAVV